MDRRGGRDRRRRRGCRRRSARARVRIARPLIRSRPTLPHDRPQVGPDDAGWLSARRRRAARPARTLVVLHLHLAAVQLAVVSVWRGRPCGERVSVAASTSYPQGLSSSGCTAGWTRSLSGGCTSPRSDRQGRSPVTKPRRYDPATAPGRPETQSAHSSVRWPAPGQVAAGPRCRPVDQIGLRRQDPQAHPTLTGIPTADPARHRNLGLLLRGAAAMP